VPEAGVNSPTCNEQSSPSVLRGFAGCELFIPCLNRGLTRNQTVPQLEHGEAIHLRTVGIGAGLREGKAVAVRDGGFDRVRHGTAAHVVPKHIDRGSALDLTRFARRIVAVDAALQ
jgi:hypothetical protein